jgi:hypothetical protein
MIDMNNKRSLLITLGLALILITSLIGCTSKSTPTSTTPIYSPTSSATLTQSSEPTPISAPDSPLYSATNFPSQVILTEKSLPPIFSNMDTVWGDYFKTLFFTDSSRLVFGRLPIQLDAEFAELSIIADLPVVPEKLIAYKVIRPVVDETFAQNMAQRVGFNGPLEFYNTDNTYRVYDGDPPNDSPVFFIYPEGAATIYYIRNIYPRSASLPSDQECIEIARKWLNSSNLYPDNVIKITTTPYVVNLMTGRIESQYTAATWVSFVIGLDGYELFGMGAYFLIGENGTVREVHINVPEFEPYSYVKIQKPEIVMETLQDYLKNPDKFGINTPECLTRAINRNVSIENISLKYLAMISPNNTQAVYAQPIYVFEGKGRNQPELRWDTFIGAGDAVSR